MAGRRVIFLPAHPPGTIAARLSWDGAIHGDVSSAGRPTAQSAPEPLQATGSELPVDARSRQASAGSPGAGMPTVELPKTAVEPVGAVIDLLKPNHRRRALRDPRLVPRAKSTRLPLWLVGLFSFRSSARTSGRFEEGEVRRLCSPTMRTQNTVLRDLVADEAQLARHGLPLWRTEDDVAEALGISLKQLRFFCHPSRDRPAFTLRELHDPQAIRKSAGHSRAKRRLKQLQRRVLDLLVRKLPVSEHATASSGDVRLPRAPPRMWVAPSSFRWT